MGLLARNRFTSVMEDFGMGSHPAGTRDNRHLVSPLQIL